MDRRDFVKGGLIGTIAGFFGVGAVAKAVEPGVVVDKVPLPVEDHFKKGGYLIPEVTLVDHGIYKRETKCWKVECPDCKTNVMVPVEPHKIWDMKEGEQVDVTCSCCLCSFKVRSKRTYG